MRTPHSSTIGLLGMAKLEIQTLSLPSTTAAQGHSRSVTGEKQGRFTNSDNSNFET